MINQIHIQNFKSIKSLQLDLGNVTILIGANGAGKSNFIAFFDLLYAICQQNLQNYTAQNGGSEYILHFGNQVSDFLKGTIQFNKKITYTFQLEPTILNSFYFYEEKWIEGKKTKYLVNRGTYESKLLSNIPKEEGKNYFDNVRLFHFHDTSKTAKIKQLSKLHDNYYLRNDGSNLASFLYYLQQKHPKHFLRIQRVVRSIAPFFDRFILQPNRLNEQMIALQWKEKGIGMYLNAHNLSDGTLRFIALTTLLLQPEPPKTIIIDEPELGLHPFAINKLAGLIHKAASKSQIILSTQSVGLVNNFETHQIITVDRADKQSIFRQLEAEKLTGWLEDYSLGQLWEKNVIGGQPS